ncbi:MAG: nitrogen fixation protein NifM [Methylovulum miyakonense]|uniref:nitrogen fixation protein NifM n=1 Tax=Methylovulum miyakonense TaxID=645578 RepID=UPI003BB722F4
MSQPQTEAYNLLRAALTLFQKSPAQLAAEELQQVRVQASNELKLENRVLNSPEAATVVITEQEVQAAFLEILGRYEAESDFLADLEQNQLDESHLRAALHRQCKVNTVLDVVGSRAPTISEVEIGIYYHVHAEQFKKPEMREAWHIFISINPDYPENTREMALQRIQELGARLQKKPYKFADLALRHSECPTSLQGGILGNVPRGKLYPEIDAVLFTLKEGEISGVVESEIGFHLVLCKHIHKPETLSLAKATPKIRQLMGDRAKRTCQRAWLAGLGKDTDERH